MATYTKFNSFVEALAEKVHNLGSDQLEVALTAAANAPVAANTVLATLAGGTGGNAQISYTNCSARTITTSTSAQSNGTYKLVVADLTLTASGGTVGPFRFITVFNQTASNDELICFYDYGSEITLQAGETFTIDFDATNGLLQLA